MPIFRAVAAVVVGFAAMGVAVFASQLAASLIMGVDRTYRPESYDVSALWISVSFALGLAAAIVGGLVSALVAMRGSRAPMILAGLVLVVGLLMAIPVLTATPAEPEARTSDISFLDAAQKARQPVFVALFNPLIGAAGVLLGARLRRRSAVPAPAPGTGTATAK